MYNLGEPDVEHHMMIDKEKSYFVKYATMANMSCSMLTVLMNYTYHIEENLASYMDSLPTSLKKDDLWGFCGDILKPFGFHRSSAGWQIIKEIVKDVKNEVATIGECWTIWDVSRSVINNSFLDEELNKEEIINQET